MAFRNQKFELSPRLKSGVGRGYSQNQILKFAAVICLVIAVVLTVNAIRLMLKSKDQVAADPSAPAVLGASDVKNSNAPASVQFTAYTVQKGDTLFNIAQKFGISWTTLATLNNIKTTSLLKPGQTLNVPKQ